MFNDFLKMNMCYQYVLMNYKALEDCIIETDLPNSFQKQNLVLALFIDF